MQPAESTVAEQGLPTNQATHCPKFRQVVQAVIKKEKEEKCRSYLEDDVANGTVNAGIFEIQVEVEGDGITDNARVLQLGGEPLGKV